jgi:hypothetical protein
MQHQAVPAVNLSDPSVANAFMAQYNSAGSTSRRGGHGNGRGGSHGQDGARPNRPQPVDKPRSRHPIPGCAPWELVYTKYGRRFAYNPAKNASYWRIPDKLKAGIIELDHARILGKAAGADNAGKGEATAEPEGEAKQEVEAGPATTVGEMAGDEAAHDYDSSEYEEVEVTDDEEDGDAEDGDEHAPKRQRTEEPGQEDQAVEFTEADIAAQLAAMAAGDDEGDGEYYEEGWEEGDEGLPLSESDARELFKDLLNDFNINPYSPWEKLLEEGKVFDDSRYTVLPTTKARREVWEQWSRDKIRQLKEQRAKEEKKDPRIAYLAFLQQHATPKLYWAEFKRKYKKEQPMKDTALSDKDREKLYRDHINRLKLPQSTLKSDLKALLESIPLSQLNNRSNVAHLAVKVLVDLRYISLEASARDAIIEAYIQTLGPLPSAEGQHMEEEDEATQRAREERRKRERALQERERAVTEQKKMQERRLQYGKANLRDEERELERAMQVGKKGLHSQLVDDAPPGVDASESR